MFSLYDTFDTKPASRETVRKLPDPRPPGERNDFLQSSVGPDRSDRPADVATAARNLAQLGYLSVNDPAVLGTRTTTLCCDFKKHKKKQ